MLRGAAAGSLLLGATQCSLSGVADYDIEQCSVKSGGTLESDPCARLNASKDGCQLYQCGASSGVCELRGRDFDRDGEVAPECGGTDCNDQDPTVGVDAPEVCDPTAPYRDNDCDGDIDEELVTVPELEPAYPVQGSLDVAVEGQPELSGAFVQKLATGQCIQGIDGAFNLLRDGCVFPHQGDPGFLPRQPVIREIGVNGHATAYVETGSGCVVGSLGYRAYDQGQVSGHLLAACGEGVALPALHVLPDRKEALIFHIQAPVSLRDDPLEDCAALTPAPLIVSRVRDAASLEPKLTASYTLSDSSMSLGRLDVERLPNVGALVGAAHAGGAALFVIDELTDTAPPALDLPGFEDARAIAIGARNSGPFDVAVIGELGCAPQKLVFQLLELDPPNVVAKTNPLELTLPEGSSFAMNVGVIWVEPRGEWLLSWLSDGPRVHGQRVRANGTFLGSSFVIAENATTAAVDAAGNVIAFTAATNPPEFRSGALGCF